MGGPPSPWHERGSPSGLGAPQQHLELSNILTFVPALPSASGLDLLGFPTHTYFLVPSGVCGSERCSRCSHPQNSIPNSKPPPPAGRTRLQHRLPPTTFHVPYFLARSLGDPQVPSSIQGPHGGPPFTLTAAGVRRGPEAPGVGGRPSCPGPTAAEDTGRICIQALWLQVTSAGVLVWG